MLRSVMALVLSALLGACAQLPSPEGMLRPPGAAIAAYALSGRITVRQGEQRYVASIAWQHDEHQDEVLISGPLGQGIAELSRDARGARLTMADRREFTAPDWEALSAKVFGFPLPLSLLPRWLVADAPEGAARDAAGRPKRFVSMGWQVDYLDYESETDDALPQLLELKRDDMALRLKIDEWQMVR